VKRLVSWRFLLPGLVLFGSALWFTPVLWQKADAWVEHQRDLVWERVEKFVGQKVVYERIAPNVLAALDFQNVRILAEDGSTVLTAASIRFSWDWSLVLAGRFSEALRKVRLINATLDVDARRDAALLLRWESLADTSASGGVEALGLQLEAFNLALRWTDGVRSLALDRAFLTLSPKQNEWGLRYRGTLLAQDRSSSKVFASVAVRGDLRSDAAFKNLNLRAELSQVTTSWFDLEPITLQIAVDPSQIVITKVADQVPLDLQVRWDRVADSWELKGEADRFRPSRLIHAKAAGAWRELAEGVATGRFFYRTDGTSGFEGRASWPAGVLPAPFGDAGLEAEGAVRAESGLLHFVGLRLETPAALLDFDGSVETVDGLPEGRLRVERWDLSGAGRARASLDLIRSRNRVEFTGEEIGWNALRLAEPKGWFEKTAEGWSYQVAGQLGGAQGELVSSGQIRAQDLAWDLSIKASSLPLDLVFEEWRRHQSQLVVPKALVSWQADVSSHFAGQRTELTAAESSFEIRDPDRSDRRTAGRLGWKERHLSLTVSEFRWDTVSAAATLSASFEDAGSVGWTLHGTLWDRVFDLKGSWDPFGRSIVFSGSPGIEGRVLQDLAGSWVVQLTLQPLEVVPGWTLGFQGQTVIREDDWTLDAERVTVSGRYPWNKETFVVRTKFHSDPASVHLSELVWKDDHGTLDGELESAWSPNFVRPWVGSLILATPATGRETLAASWTGTAAEHWHFAVKTSGADISRIGLPGLLGRLNLTASGDWAGKERTWSAQASLSEAQYGDSPLGFRASFSGTSSHLSVRGLNVAVSSIRVADGSLEVDALGRTWQAGLGFGLRLGTNDWESRWLADGNWTSPGKPWRTDFKLKTRSNTWAKRVFPDWAVRGYWGDAGWQAFLEDGGLTGVGQPDGSFQIRAESPFPFQAEAAGTWSLGVLNLAVKGFRADLALVKSFFNSKLFAVNSGEAVGDFSLGGSPSDPDVNGRLVLTGLTFESSFVRHPVGPVDVPVLLEGHQVRIDPVNVGPPGQVWFVAGIAKLDHLLPEEFQFSVETDALSSIPASYQYSGISATGSVSGLFVVKGNSQGVTLGGRLVLEDTTITLKDTNPSPEDAALDINADLTLITGRRVEFFWPNKTLPLIQTVTAPGQTMQIRANQVASTWSLNGKLALKTGEINYLNRTFLLREGVLVFQEDQSRFDPQVSLRGEWRVQEDVGPVIVILRADGSLAKFSPRFESSPYLSPAILQQLVGTSLGPGTDSSSSKSADAALSLASDVGAGFLLTPLEESVKRNLNLDLFTVQTQLLKTTLLKRNASPNAVDYLDNSRLFFGKYIGDDLFLQGTLAFFQGVTDATQVSQVVEVDPEIEVDLETPFFMLNWTLLLQHPNTYFVSDNAVTLRWNWSY